MRDSKLKFQHSKVAIRTHTFTQFFIMDNNKLIQILKTFSRKEWREFSKFVESPYFNTDKHCIRLLQILKREFAKKDEFQLSRTRLEKLFSKNNTADASLLNVKLSLLTRLAEEFLIQHHLKSKNLYRKHLLLEEFHQRGLSNHFERAYNKKEVFVFGVPQKISPEFYGNKMLVEYSFAKHITTYKKKIGVRENLQEVNDSLDIYYFLKKIDLFTSIIPIENMYDKSYDNSAFELLETLIQLPRYANHPVLQVYYAAFQMIRFRDDTSYYRKFWDLLETNSQLIEAFSLYRLCSMCANYCIQKMVAGHIDFQQGMYEVYRMIDEEGLFLLEEYVDVGLLRNSVEIASIIGEIEWASYILEKYKNKITPDVQEPVYMYCRSLLSFYQKKYGETISHLSGIQPVSDTFDIGIKFMLMKAYYEHDEDFCYPTQQVFRSFKAFIKQHKKIAKTRKEGCINFANVLTDLYRIRHGEGRGTLDAVMEKINQCEFIVGKSWLTEKAEELISVNGSFTPLRANS